MHLMGALRRTHQSFSLTVKKLITCRRMAVDFCIDLYRSFARARTCMCAHNRSDWLMITQPAGQLVDVVARSFKFTFQPAYRRLLNKGMQLLIACVLNTAVRRNCSLSLLETGNVISIAQITPWVRSHVQSYAYFLDCNRFDSCLRLVDLYISLSDMGTIPSYNFMNFILRDERSIRIILLLN